MLIKKHRQIYPYRTKALGRIAPKTNKNGPLRAAKK